MRKVYIAIIVGFLGLFGLAFLKNRYSYPSKSTNWKLGKSLVDTSLVIASALYAPALLIGWCSYWLTRFINRRSVQITLAILASVLFGTIGGVALEILCVIGVLAVDTLTGEQGLYGWLKEPIPKDFVPSLL